MAIFDVTDIERMNPMSVVLLVERLDGMAYSMPVATEAEFRRYWVPLCEELALVWVPLFQSGFPVAEGDIAGVLEELSRLVRHVEAQGAEEGPIRERIQRLAQSLEQVDYAGGEKAYIG